MMSELLGGYAAARRAGWAHVERMVGDVLSLHPNYVALLDASRAEYASSLTGYPLPQSRPGRSSGVSP
jgi:hypothetical protein